MTIVIGKDSIELTLAKLCKSSWSIRVGLDAETEKEKDDGD